MNRRELLSLSAEKALKEIISKKGGDTSKDVFDNLEYLTDKATSYGEDFYYIPVLIKKLLCTYIDPDYRIEYVVTKGSDWCEVEARLYWSDSEQPAGIGFVRRYANQISPFDSLSKEERLSQLEANCRGASATRAIADAGVASHFWGDMSGFEIKGEMEEAEASAKMRAETKVPEVKSAVEKKAEKREKAKSKAETTASELPSAKEVFETTSNDFASEEVVFAEDCSTPSFFDFLDEETPDGPDGNTEETVASEEISLETAMNVVSDMGTYKGQTLGNIYKMMPRNLVYLATHSSTVGKYARVIIATDEVLSDMLKSAEEV